MSKISWDNVGEHYFEIGIDQVVLYPKDSNGNYQKGIAWNGVLKINESPSMFEVRSHYLDNVKYLQVSSIDEYSATLDAISAPKEFSVCDGSSEVITGLILGQQTRMEFGLCYRTLIGNNIDGYHHGYKLHLIYNAVASASKRELKTISGSPDILVYSWSITTKGIPVENRHPVASLVLDSRKVNSLMLSRIESKLYGLDGSIPNDPYLPLPLEVISSTYPFFTVGVTAIGQSQIIPSN